ncbi:hypothetical protein BBD42_28655 [Paenibacillus sp. BIHB 4019]|uniref:DUF5107 domain-containing protein n=1 Tax=Paenibacillus sp. BIHB 4019 TaxID=1870819 RepID=A0A1B2DQR0_9BACL|nr:hypothetical protein [Paenibacillus sp. BIHB 4019]ANY70030.1 hypothetical protein BBD42_28655 [Paenibacillus sp. BIHB 4019]
MMESTALRMTILPDCGGKIQSIYDKKRDQELLYQNDADVPYKRSKYDDSYASGDVSGFDEVFPSIESCYYPSPPWQGTRIPDHGEVWSLSWEQEHISDFAINLSVHGVRFPYKLEKTIQFVNENAIRISYRVHNFSEYEMPFIWAPHALWVCDKDMRVVLPSSIQKVMSTCSIENRLGLFGTIHDWPKTTVNGLDYDINRLYPKYEGKCEKYYGLGHIQEGWCALQGAESGYTIGMAYPINEVPYLGVWEGIMNGKYVTALEPCTGAFDSLDTAMQWKSIRAIQPKSYYDWYLTITIGNKQGTIKAIHADGIIE